MAPANVPRDFGIHFRAIQQSVDHVVIVLDINIARLERSGSGGKVDRNCVLRNRDRPEQAALSGARIKIVNLVDLAEVAEYVKSYEREGAMMVTPVGAHEFAGHEAHISFERQVLRRLAGDRVRALSSHCSPAYESIEIRDAGRLCARSWQEEMEYRSVGPKQLQASGNRKRRCRGCAVAAMVFDGGSRQFRDKSGSGEYAQGDP